MSKKRSRNADEEGPSKIAKTEAGWANVNLPEIEGVNLKALFEQEFGEAETFCKITKGMQKAALLGILRNVDGVDQYVDTILEELENDREDDELENDNEEENLIVKEWKPILDGAAPKKIFYFFDLLRPSRLEVHSNTDRKKYPLTALPKSLTPLGFHGKGDYQLVRMINEHRVYFFTFWESRAASKQLEEFFQEVPTTDGMIPINDCSVIEALQTELSFQLYGCTSQTRVLPMGVVVREVIQIIEGVDRANCITEDILWNRLTECPSSHATEMNLSTILGNAIRKIKRD